MRAGHDDGTRSGRRCALVLCALALVGRVRAEPAPAAAAAPPAGPALTPAPQAPEPADARSLSVRLARVAAYGSGQLALQYAGVVAIGPVNWRGYQNSVTPSWTKFESNFRRAPVFEPEAYGGGGLLGVAQADGDPWTVNVLGHGVQGSELVLRMRREGFGWWQAALSGALQSTLWEYAVEGWHETPSGWDLAFTPVAGAALGELRHRLSQLARRRSGAVGYRALAIAVDPVGELDAWLDRALFGRR